VRLPLFAFMFHSYLPDVLGCPGFDKKLDLMSRLRYESCYGGQQLSPGDLYSEIVVGLERERESAAHSEVQGRRRESKDG